MMFSCVRFASGVCLLRMACASDSGLHPIQQVAECDERGLRAADQLPLCGRCFARNRRSRTGNRSMFVGPDEQNNLRALWIFRFTRTRSS
jgi:hypothetical protein